MSITMERRAAQIRYDLIRTSSITSVPHLACALSCVDILTCLYWQVLSINANEPFWPERDLFYLGKGHAVAALYATLAHRGYFPPEKLLELGKEGSEFEEHPGIHAPAGVEHVSGSLGHALSLATGRALGDKIRNNSKRKHVALIGDGESNEGTIWEAAMFAGAHKLTNLVMVLDFNKLQGTGRSCEIMALEPMQEKWKSFGWNTVRINGHDMNAILDAFKYIGTEEKPLAIIADTVKGKGVSFMEDDNNWHYRIPNQNEVELAYKELLS